MINRTAIQEQLIDVIQKSRARVMNALLNVMEAADVNPPTQVSLAGARAALLSAQQQQIFIQAQVAQFNANEQAALAEKNRALQACQVVQAPTTRLGSELARRHAHLELQRALQTDRQAGERRIDALREFNEANPRAIAFERLRTEVAATEAAKRASERQIEAAMLHVGQVFNGARLQTDLETAQASVDAIAANRGFVEAQANVAQAIGEAQRIVAETEAAARIRARAECRNTIGKVVYGAITCGAFGAATLYQPAIGILVGGSIAIARIANRPNIFSGGMLQAAVIGAACATSYACYTVNSGTMILPAVSVDLDLLLNAAACAGLAVFSTVANLAVSR